MRVRALLGWAAVPIAGALRACAPAPATVVVSHRCEDVRFPIYFKSGSDQLTPEGEAVIAAQARRMGPCKVGAAEVLGLADADAAPADPLALSQARAAVVARALSAAGLPAPSFDLVAEGAAGATTAGGRKAPLHRRAEVVLHAAPAA